MCGTADSITFRLSFRNKDARLLDGESGHVSPRRIIYMSRQSEHDVYSPVQWSLYLSGLLAS